MVMLVCWRHEVFLEAMKLIFFCVQQVLFYILDFFNIHYIVPLGMVSCYD